MIYEEAIRKIKEFGLHHPIEDLPYSSNTVQAFEMAIGALEKQTPKKPKETDAYPHRLYCPCCSWTLCYNKENADGFRMMNMFLYCPECGQAIDWSDNE